MATPTLDILSAVDVLIAKAREIHEGIPEVVVVLGASGYNKRRQIHGHFSSKSWNPVDTEGTVRHEIMLSGESLERGAEATLGTLLHELAHSYAFANQINDTSNNGRYHNTKFKEIGNEFGLILGKSDTIGWSVTTLESGTADLYKDGLELLTNALTYYRVPKLKVAQVAKKYQMQCPDCLDPVTVTKKWFTNNEYKLYCYKHDIRFEMVEE